MNKFKLYAISSIIVMSLIFLPILACHIEAAPLDAPLAGSYMSMSENLTIDGDDDFEDHSYIMGDGSQNNPYIITGLDMGIYSIRIENTTSYFTITDIEWGTSLEYRMIFKNNSHVRMEKLILNSNLMIEGNNCTDLKIVDCNFSNSYWNLVPVSFLNLSSLSIENSSFINDYICTYRFLGDSGTTHIINSTFTWVLLESFIRGTQIIEGSTFKYSGLSPKGITTSSEINNCIFIGYFAASRQGLKLIRDSTDCCIGIIQNNTFRNLQCGISLYGGVFAEAPRIQIINNSFETCRTWGININSWNNDIFNNTFTNTFRNAIAISTLGGQNKIWMNRFINSQTNGANVAQCSSSSDLNDWDNGIVGNYWDDHLSPDEDGNGVVDIPYNLSGLATNLDKFPFANINFDLDRPDVSFTTHSSGYSDISYHRIGWESKDEWGIQKVELKGTNGIWTNVTEINLTCVFLEEGSYNFSLKATDNSGLVSVVDLDLVLNQTVPVLSITNPADGYFAENDPVTVDWTVVDYFPVSEINFTVDGRWTQLDTKDRSRDLYFEEGYHTLSIYVKDDDNIQFTEELELTVDRTDPVIELEGPSPGSTLSSPCVCFEYQVYESGGINRIRYRFDDEDWNVTGDSGNINKLLEEGWHVFYLEALDIAGHLTEIETPFEISTRNAVDIISPLNGTFFSSSSLPLEWGYYGNFEWSSALLRVGMKNEFIPIGEIYNHEMTFSEDGEYLITLKLEDDLGNYVLSDIWVIKDSKAPTVGFLGIKNGDYLKYGNLSLHWNALDDRGIGNFQLCIDDGTWEDQGSNTSTEIDIYDGEHIVKIRAFDLADNWHEAQIQFIVDSTAPVLSFLDQNMEIHTSPQIEIEWECEDNFGIEGMDLTVESKESRDVLGRDSLTIVLTEDGEYTVNLNASDIAGNNASISMIITVDLTGPRATWIGDQISISPLSELSIQWEIEEFMGISELSLDIDGKQIELETDDTEYTLNLLEGTHTITLTVVDIAGWKYVLEYPNQVTIDTTEPALDIDESRSVTNGVATLSWTASDATSNVEAVSISLDGGAFLEVQGDRYATEKLPPGEHTLIVKVIDTAGNVAQETWTFTVEAEQKDDGEEGGFPVFLIFVIVVVLIAIAVGGGLFAYKKFGGEKGEVEIEKADASQEHIGPKPVRNRFLAAPPVVDGPKLASSTPNSLPPPQQPQEVQKGSGDQVT